VAALISTLSGTPSASSLAARFCDDPEPGAHRPQGGVFLGLGESEVDQDPVAQVLGDVSPEAVDGRFAGLLVVPNDRAQLLGVEALRERGGIRQVTKKDRDMAALGSIVRRQGLWRRRRAMDERRAALAAKPHPLWVVEITGRASHHAESWRSSKPLEEWDCRQDLPAPGGGKRVRALQESRGALHASECGS
jgi:hypothetical protein